MLNLVRWSWSVAKNEKYFFKFSLNLQKRPSISPCRQSWSFRIEHVSIPSINQFRDYMCPDLRSLVNPIPVALGPSPRGRPLPRLRGARARWEKSTSRGVHLPSDTSAQADCPAAPPTQIAAALFRVLWPWVAARENFCGDIGGTRRGFFLRSAIKCGLLRSEDASFG